MTGEFKIEDSNWAFCSETMARAMLLQLHRLPTAPREGESQSCAAACKFS